VPGSRAEHAGFVVQVGSCVKSQFLCCATMDDSLQGDAVIVLESPDQKT
jgi:hypothetical protein